MLLLDGLQVCREEVLGGPGGLPYTLFGLFDGHGGSGTSLKLAMELPLVIHQNLLELLPLLTDRWAAVQSGQEEDALSQVLLIIWNLCRALFCRPPWTTPNCCRPLTSQVWTSW